jgi:proteasome lid subunit RPN8/RPN11
MPVLFAHLTHQIIAHAEDVFPHECCGAIIDGEYHRFENVADDPEQDFEFSNEDEFRLLAGPDASRTQAIVHSHPDGMLSPTASDMLAQITTGLPFVIVAHDGGQWHYIEWGDHRLDDPLIERPFEHGVYDCGSAVRSWYWQKKGILLPDFARDDEWWGGLDAQGNIVPASGDLYAENFAKAGFKELHVSAMTDLQEGDVFFYRLAKSGVECHAGVYVGGDLIYHHLPKRLSREELLGPWFPRISRWVRYAGGHA